MRFAHIALGTRDPLRSARFFERTLGWSMNDRPNDPKAHFVWLEIAPGEEMHLIEVEGFEASRFEEEYGRHFAFKHPRSDFEALKTRLQDAGAELIAAQRPTSFARFFFKTFDGYVFEVIEDQIS